MGYLHCSMTNQVHIRQLVADLPNRASSVGPTGRPGRPPKPPRNDTAAGPLPGRFPPPRPRSKPTFPPFPPAAPAKPTGFPPTPECSLFAVDGCSLSALGIRAPDGTGRSVGDRRDYVIIAVRYTLDCTCSKRHHPRELIGVAL